MVGTPLRQEWRREWKIMLEQFIATGVVVKDEVIYIDIE
jgi:hypothetical protein